jgi:hypothetical protein
VRPFACGRSRAAKNDQLSPFYRSEIAGPRDVKPIFTFGDRLRLIDFAAQKAG